MAFNSFAMRIMTVCSVSLQSNSKRWISEFAVEEECSRQSSKSSSVETDKALAISTRAEMLGIFVPFSIRTIPDWEIKFSGSIRRAAMLVWKQFLSGISGTRSSYGECMTAFAEYSAGKHGKAAAFGQNTHISVHQRQMFVKLLSILRPCNVHGFCL